MVVACLFAGVGAWGAKVTVDNVHTYASELFGEGHKPITYPSMTTGEGADATTTVLAPRVVLTIPSDGVHNGSALIEFMLSDGVFESNIAGLMYDSDPTDTTEAVVASGAIATIESGGQKGDSSITILVKEAATDGRTVGTDGTTTTVTIHFTVPKLSSLESLGGASGTKTKSAVVTAMSTLRSGGFTSGSLTMNADKTDGKAVVMSRDSLTVEIENAGDLAVMIDGDSKFMAVKGAKEPNGSHIATVTIKTKQVKTPAAPETKLVVHQHIDSSVTLTDGELPDDIETTGVTFTPRKDEVTLVNHKIYDLNGEDIDAGLRGTLTMTAMGDRDLFNDGDMMFIDYDGDGKMGNSEGIAVDPDMMNMASGVGLSIDPDVSESFNAAGTGMFKVYYKAGGKAMINHGSKITVTANVDYSDTSARDEAPVSSTTTLNLDGVTGEVKAYAIAQTGNSRGDTSNLRVRCEESTDCRVFLECWGDGGTETRGFGEVEGGVPANGVKRWTAADVEDVTDRMADSRHSCRILSKGMVTVQQLTRSDGVLVNNTYVGDGM